MSRYRLITYVLELATVLGVAFSLALPWHTEHGNGFEVLGLALLTKVAMGHPFEPEMIPLSQWWLMWIIPLVSFTLGLRSFVGYIFVEEGIKEHRGKVLVLLGAQAIITGWYYATFREGLLYGYAVVIGCVILLTLTTLFELFMPEKTREQHRLDKLPADHIDRLMAGEYRVCPACGEYNRPDAKNCRACNYRILPKIEPPRK